MTQVFNDTQVTSNTPIDNLVFYLTVYFTCMISNCGEKTRVPGVKQFKHMKNMQSLHKKPLTCHLVILSYESNRGLVAVRRCC